MSKDQTDIKGVVAILTDPNGNVIASATDFGRQGWGGFTLRKAQEHRARNAVARSLVEAYCAPLIAQVIEACQEQEMLDRLCVERGYKLTIVPVGHPEGDAP